MYTTLITAQELQALQQTPQPVLLLDVRFDLNDATFGQQVYDVGHIAGAHYLHLDRELSGVVSGHNGRHPLPERKHLAHWLRNHGLNANTQVVIYDQGSTMFAARAWALLRWLGHEAVAVLNGGLPAWLRAGGSLSTEVPAKPEATDWQTGESLLQVVSADEVMPTFKAKRLWWWMRAVQSALMVSRTHWIRCLGTFHAPPICSSNSIWMRNNSF